MPKPKKTDLPPLDRNTEPVGKRIAKIRKHRGLTQTQFGERIGITQTLVSDYEIGRAHLSDEMLIRFALELRISVDYLLGLEKSEHIEPISRTLANKMAKIEKLPPNEKKALLKNIDMFLKASIQDDTR